jgi:hypothetical protein
MASKIEDGTTWVMNSRRVNLLISSAGAASVAAAVVAKWENQIEEPEESLAAT